MSTNGETAPAWRWSDVLVCVILTTLLISRSAPALLCIPLFVAGLFRLTHAPRPQRDDWMFFTALAIYPAAHALNMLASGVDQNLFDRPSRLIGAFALYFVLRERGIARQALFLGACLGALGSALSSLYQLYEMAVPRVGTARGPFVINPIMMGNHAVLLAFFIATFRPPGRHGLLIALPFLGAALFTALASQTRSSWLAIPLVLWLLADARLRPHQLAVAALAGSLLAGAAYAGIGIVRTRIDIATHEVVSFFAHGGPEALQTSVGQRLHMWQTAWRAFADHPLMGVGLAHFDGWIAAEVAAGRADPVLLKMPHAHNELIQAMAGGGLLLAGALVLHWLLTAGWFLRHLRGSTGLERSHAAAGLAATLSLIIFHQFESMFGTLEATMSMVFFFVFAAAGVPRRAPSA